MRPGVDVLEEVSSRNGVTFSGESEDARGDPPGQSSNAIEAGKASGHLHSTRAHVLHGIDSSAGSDDGEGVDDEAKSHKSEPFLGNIGSITIINHGHTIGQIHGVISVGEGARSALSVEAGERV